MACRCGGMFCIHAQPRHDMYGCRTPSMPSIQVTLTSWHGLDKCFSKQSQFFPDALLRSRSQSLLLQKQLCVRNFQILWLEDLGREIGDLPHHHHDNHFPFYFFRLIDQNFKVRFCIICIYVYNYFSFSVFSHCVYVHNSLAYRFILAPLKISQLIKSLPTLGRHLRTASDCPVRFDWNNSTMAQRYDRLEGDSKLKDMDYSFQETVDV